MRRAFHLSLPTRGLLIALALLIPSVSSAAPGRLDDSFGSMGRVESAFPVIEEFPATAIASLAFDDAGRIVVAGPVNGHVAIARYSPDGSLDSSFGGDGVVETSLSGYDCSLELDAAGRIVVAGIDGTMIRLDPSGALDLAFGSDGSVEMPIGASDLALDAGGRILVAGGAFVARFLATGVIDGTFGTEGVAMTSLIVNAMAVDRAGRIVLAGEPIGASELGFAVARHLFDGRFDTTFDQDGVTIASTAFSTISETAAAVAIDRQGRIVVAGTAASLVRLFAVMRFNTDGTLDDTFDSDGVVTTSLAEDDDWESLLAMDSEASSVAIDSTGRIIVAGGSLDRSGLYPIPRGAIAYYNQNGSLDTAYDEDGKLNTPLLCKVNQLRLDESGRMVLGGWVPDVIPFLVEGSQFALARYFGRIQVEDDDILVTRFAPGGGDAKVILVDAVSGAQTPVSEDGLLVHPRSLAIDGSGRVVVADSVALGGSVLDIDVETGAQSVLSSGGLFASGLTDLAFESTGKIIVLRGSSVNSVIRVDPDTGTQSLLTSGGLLSGPGSVAIGPDDSIFILDEDADRVVRVDPTTGAQTLVSSGGLISLGSGLDIEAGGGIIASDRDALGGAGAIYRVDRTSGTQTALSNGGFFSNPSGIAIEASGNALVTDVDALGSGAIIRVDALSGAQSLLSSGGFISGPRGIGVLQRSGFCGDGVIDVTEACDDGNGASGDCCSSTCDFEAANCAVLTGRLLQLKDPKPGSDPSKRTAKVHAKESNSLDTLVGDPITGGAILELKALGDSSTAQSFALAAGVKGPGVAGWTTIKGGYKYLDSRASVSSVKSLLIQKSPAGTFQIKVVLSGRGSPLTVAPPNSGTEAGMKLAIGGGRTYCMRLGGEAGGFILPTSNDSMAFQIQHVGAIPAIEAGCP